MKPQVQGDVQDLSPGSRIVTAIQGRPVVNTPPASSQVMGWNSSNKQWAPMYPPGYEIGYDQITATVNVTSTTEATPTTVISCAAHVFDGSPVLVSFFTPGLTTPNNAAGDFIRISLFESTTEIGVIAFRETPSSTHVEVGSISGFFRFTPTAGSHTYTIGGSVNSTVGTPAVGAGAGGTGAFVPAFVRFTKI